MEEIGNKKGKGNIILIVIIFILLCITGYLSYDKFFNNKNKDISEEKTLKVYGRKEENDTYFCEEKNNSCNDLVLEIKTDTNDAFVLDIKEDYNRLSNKSSYILYYDNGIKIYKPFEKTIETVETTISNDKLVNYIKKYWNEKNYIAGGFIFSYEENNYSKYFLYDIENAKKKFTDYTKLSSVYYIDNSITFGESSVLSTSRFGYDEYISNSTEYIQGIKDNKSVLVNIKTGKSVIEKDFTGLETLYFIHQGCNEKSLFFSIDKTPDGSYDNKVIYSIDGKKIREIKANELVEFNNCMYWGQIKVYKTDVIDTY